MGSGIQKLLGLASVLHSAADDTIDYGKGSANPTKALVPEVYAAKTVAANLPRILLGPPTRGAVSIGKAAGKFATREAQGAGRVMKAELAQIPGALEWAQAARAGLSDMRANMRAQPTLVEKGALAFRWGSPMWRLHRWLMQKANEKQG